MMFANPLHSHTPALTVIEPRGELSREVTYLRIDTGDIQAHVTRTGYDIAGRSTSHWDPRMWAASATQCPIPPNVRITASLSGATLLEASTDSGPKATLADSSGQPCQAWTQRSARRTVRDSLGRPAAIHERMGKDAERCAERFTHAGADASAGCAGRLVRHDDPGGTRIYESYGIDGDLCRDTRHFLVDIAEPDWPEDIARRTVMVEVDAFTTVRQHDARGDTTSQIDAFGNTQRVVKHPDGQVRESWLRLAGGTDRCIADTMVYNAARQLVARTLGNGVTTTWRYEETDHRLLDLVSRRPDGSVLQELYYACDPTRRVLAIDDAAQPRRIFAGRRIQARGTFLYDTLGRLVEATGLEQSGATHGPGLPAWQPFPPGTLVNYRRAYRYDAAGNLLRLQHTGASSYERTMRVAATSNRSLPTDSGDMDIDDGFDPSGNLRRLQAGQELTWNGLEQLAAVRLVDGSDGTNDTERHVYDGDGARVRKWRTRRIGGRDVIDEVRYLHGVDVRSNGSTGDRVHIVQGQIVVGSMQVLHWPSVPPNGLTNDAYRYSLVDHLGSCAIEVDDAAAVISQELYYPFGGTSSAATGHALEADYRVRRYAGKERDASGLYYYGSRFYAPWLHRWTQPDPSGIADGLNRYAFVHDDPVNHVDTGGRIAIRLDNLTWNNDWRPAATHLSDYADVVGIPSASGTRVPVDERTLDHLALADRAIHWTKDILHYGAANQATDILLTHGQSYERLSANRGDIEQVVRSGTGQCGEHAHIAFALLAQEPLQAPMSWVGGEGVDHAFVVIGDHRAQPASEIVVVDAWVTLPTAHLLSEGQFGIGATLATVPPGHVAHKWQIDSDWIAPLPAGFASQTYAEELIVGGFSHEGSGMWNQLTSVTSVGAVYTHGNRSASYDRFDAGRLKRVLDAQPRLRELQNRARAAVEHVPVDLSRRHP